MCLQSAAKHTTIVANVNKCIETTPDHNGTVSLNGHIIHNFKSLEWDKLLAHSLYVTVHVLLQHIIQLYLLLSYESEYSNAFLITTVSLIVSSWQHTVFSHKVHIDLYSLAVVTTIELAFCYWVLCVDHKVPFPSVVSSFLVTVVGCRISSLAFSKLFERRSVRGHRHTTNQPRLTRIPRATFSPVHSFSQSGTAVAASCHTHHTQNSTISMQCNVKMCWAWHATN